MVGARLGQVARGLGRRRAAGRSRTYAAGVGELEETFGTSVNARMASHVGEGAPEPVDDLERTPERGEPPVAGAQWDELHRRWEVWDAAAEAWVIVGDDPGDGVPPSEENLIPPLLAREVLHAEEVEAHHQVVPDITRTSPTGPAPPGAQWNEVVARWERWDEATESWVEAGPEPAEPDST